MPHVQRITPQSKTKLLLAVLLQPITKTPSRQFTGAPVGSRFTLSRRTISPLNPSEMMPADPEPAPERLDETQVKTIQTKINNKLDPATPVRTRACRRAQSLAALARSMTPADSPTATSPIA